MKALRVSGGIALLFLGSRHTSWGWGGQPYALAASTPGKDPVPILQEAGLGPRDGLDGWKISCPPGFESGPSSPLSVAILTELPGPK